MYISKYNMYLYSIYPILYIGTYLKCDCQFGKCYSALQEIMTYQISTETKFV